VLAPNATELRIVANQVRQFPALLHEVGGGEPLNLALKSVTPIRSLRIWPESLKLSVWSKSDARRKCYWYS
jgi:hypothetical protein